MFPSCRLSVQEAFVKPRLRLTAVFPVDLSLLTLSLCACPPESILPPPYSNGVYSLARDGFFIKTDPTRTVCLHARAQEPFTNPVSTHSVKSTVWSLLLNEKPQRGVCFQLGFCLWTRVHVKSLEEVLLAKSPTS